MTEEPKVVPVIPGSEPIKNNLKFMESLRGMFDKGMKGEGPLKAKIKIKKHKGLKRQVVILKVTFPEEVVFPPRQNVVSLVPRTDQGRDEWGRVKISRDELLAPFKDNPGRVFKTRMIADILLSRHDSMERQSIQSRLNHHARVSGKIKFLGRGEYVSKDED